MKKVYDECKRLIEANALHRKPRDHVAYGIGEMNELLQAECNSLRLPNSTWNKQTRRDDCLEELADTINALMFYAASKGFTAEHVETECLRKLQTRFVEEKPCR